jgi:hypothetical protein
VRSAPKSVRRWVRARRTAMSVTVEKPQSRSEPAHSHNVLAADAKVIFFDKINQGKSLEESAVATVRKLIKISAWGDASSFAAALAARPETRIAGRLASGVAASQRKLPTLALAELNDVPDAAWRKHALGEYLDATYRSHPARMPAVLTDLLAEHADGLGGRGMFDVVKYSMVIGDLELARRAYQVMVEQAAADPRAWRGADVEIEWLRRWVEDDGASRDRLLPAGQVPVALLDYKQPGRAKTSQNIGDHVQSLAALGHLARHRHARFHGDHELAEFASELQQRVQPDRYIDSGRSDVALFPASRDATTFESFPEGTWLLAFGWYMHPLFGVRHDFPFHPNLRPIFISFHCNKREMLTDDAIAYLRRYGPVGCRDWTTVDLLLSVGVPAFFSGCLTTTVDTLFAPLKKPGKKATVYVDAPDVPDGAQVVRHSYREVKDRSFVENLREAVNLLDRYRTTFSDVTTSRLHCYLPTRSLGMKVNFQPKSHTDVRFNGLINIDNSDFDAMRARILDRIGVAMTGILAGKPDEEVYRLWRQACADDVTAAQARHAAPVVHPPTQLDVVTSGREMREGAVSSGPSGFDGAIDVVMPVSALDLKQCVRTLHSLQETASQPVHVWMLASGCGAADRKRVAKHVPDMRITWLNPGKASPDAGLLLLPHVLSDVARVVMLPPGALVRGKLAELADYDLDGYPLAARTSCGATSGFGRLYRAARQMPADAAHEYYRMIHGRHVFDFDAFDTRILVLDLERMRKDHVGEEFLPFVENVKFTWTDVLNLYVGPDRAALPAEWAHDPGVERVAEPKIVHWPGKAKPWSGAFAPSQELWEARQ